jgi:hypothetical protein
LATTAAAASAAFFAAARSAGVGPELVSASACAAATSSGVELGSAATASAFACASPAASFPSGTFFSSPPIIRKAILEDEQHTIIMPTPAIATAAMVLLSLNI